MLKWPLLSVPTFLLAQMLFVKWATGNERRPTPPDPAGLPAQLDGWKRFSDQPVTLEMFAEKVGVIRDLSKAKPYTGLMGTVESSLRAMGKIK